MRAQPKQIGKKEAGRLIVAWLLPRPFFSLRLKNGLSKWLTAASFFAHEDKGGEGSAPQCYSFSLLPLLPPSLFLYPFFTVTSSNLIS